MNDKVWRILLVDDEYSLREPLARFLQANYNFKVDTAASRMGALQLAAEAVEPHDVILIDDTLPENETDPESFPMAVGVELMTQIKERTPHTECIIFTGWSGTERGIEALRAGAYRYMSKPFDHEELAMTIQMAAQHRALRKRFEITEQQKEWLQTFIDIGKATTSLRSLDEVLTEVHGQIGKLMDVSEMDIVLYDEVVQMLNFELCYDRGIQQKKWQRSFGDGFTEWVIEQEQSLLIQHYDEEMEISPAIANLVAFDEQDEITQSYLGVPLVARDTVIGAINIQSYVPNKFDETDQYVLSAIAGQVAGAIQNARLFSNLHREREQTQALLQSSLDAIVAIDNNKHITVFNKQAEKFFGRIEAEMLEKQTASLFENVETGRQIFDELDGDTFITERLINFKHKNGQVLPGLFSATVIRDEGGQSIGQAGFIRDLRQVKLLEIRQRAWSDVSQAVTKSKNLEEILNLIVHSTAKSIFSADDSEIHLYQDGNLCMNANTINYSKEVAEAICFKEGEGINGKVFQSRQPIIVNDVKTDSRFKQISHPESAPFASMICVPIQTSDQTLGTLSLTSKKTASFEKVDIDLLNSFASQAAIVIRNAQLLNEAHQGLNSLKSISKASSILISKQEPQKVLRSIVEQARNALGAWRASAILIDSKGRPHELADDGYKHAPDVDKVIRKNGISMQVMKRIEPCFIESINDANQKGLNSDMERDNVHAAACLPLKLGTNAIGVMWIQYKKSRIFTETEREALQIYSEQAALAYDKTRQMQELHHMRQATEALAGAADLPEVLMQIVSSARIVLAADSAAIWSYDTVREKFLPNDSVANGIEPAIWEQFKQEEPQVGQTADTVMKRGSIIIEDVADSERYPFLGRSTRRLLKQTGIKGFQGITLTVDDECLGVLYINYCRSRDFSVEEQETASTFANHAALALKKARLLNQVSKAQDMARIVARVTALENLDDTLEQLTDGTIQTIGCDAIVLYEYNKEKDRLSYPPKVAGVKEPEKTRRWLSIPKDNLIYKMLYHEGVYIVGDVDEDPLFKGRRFVVEEGIVSCVAIPLQVRSVKVGVMFINYRKSHRFTHEELKHIELFGNQAAVAIRNAQLYEQLQHRAELLEALHESNHSIHSSLDSKDTLDRILEQAARITSKQNEGVQYACIRIVENDTSRLLSTYPSDLSLETRNRLINVKDFRDAKQNPIGIVGRAAISGDVQLIGDVSKHPDYHRVDLLVKSAIAVPFRLREAVTIVINVEHRQYNAFDEDDRWALGALATQAAIAIENAQLYQESKTFGEVAEALSSTNNLDDVLDVVIRKAMGLTNTHMGSITFWDTENECASDSLRVENDGKLHRYPSVARPDGVTRWIVDNNKSVVTPDKRLAGNPNPNYQNRENGFLAEAGVPVVNREKVLGVLYIRHPQPRHFPERQIEMLETLGKQAGIAIARAMHFEEMQQIKGYIGSKTAVEWIQMVSTTWGHSIKREVGIADGRLSLLKTAAEQQNTDELETEIKHLRNVLKRITKLPITAPLSYENITTSIPINNLIETYQKRQWRHVRYKNINPVLDIQPDLDDIAQVWASPEWLRRGFELIVDNAVSAMEYADIPNQEIRISTRIQGSEIRIIFENNGPSISKAILKLYQQERPVPKKEGDRGSGIGLQLARTIMETYRGTMQIERRKGRGTKVIFILPAHNERSIS